MNPPSPYPPSPEDRKQELIGALIIVIGILAIIILCGFLKYMI